MGIFDKIFGFGSSDDEPEVTMGLLETEPEVKRADRSLVRSE